MVNETAKEGFRRLAFGGIHDAVRLLFCEDVNPRTLKNMDLFAVSEIRRPKNGGMEIRFFDRIEALRLLSELETSGTGAQALLSAIESGAAALKTGISRDAVFRKADAGLMLVGRKKPAPG